MRLDTDKIQGSTGVRTILLDMTDSTNTQAKKMIYTQPLPLLVIADRQSAGRGRMGRRFVSNGQGIYMSFAFKTDTPQSSVSVTTAAASAVTRALCRHTEGDFKIKWVNDILLDGKKVCGILTEGVSCGDEHFVIVGIGINIGRCEFEGELADIAAGVELLSSPEELVSDIAMALCEFANDPSSREYMKYYREKFSLCGLDVNATLDGESISGRVLGVTDDGGLVLKVKNEDAERIILSGEVSIRIKNN